MSDSGSSLGRDMVVSENAMHSSERSSSYKDLLPEERELGYVQKPDSPGLDPAIRRKVDLHVIPVVAVLYLLSFLDRSNIGNAKIAGLTKDLHLNGEKYNLAAALFYVTYAIAGIPANIMLKLTSPSKWIPSIMVAWGIVVMSTAFVKSFAGLVVARLFLGLTEAGFPPGVAYYITLWYRKNDQARALSIYFAAASVAGAFGGLLAFGIEKLDGKSGLKGWQWIFLLEGLATVVIAFIAYFILSDNPEKAKFLSPAEKETLIDVIAHDTVGEQTHFDLRIVRDMMIDPTSWLLAFSQFGAGMSVQAVSLFLPTIIKALGYTTSKAQLLSVPPYAIAGFMTIVIGVLSDWRRVRGPFIMWNYLVAITGFAILYVANPKKHPHVGYGGVILAVTGVFPVLPLSIAWVSKNSNSQLRKAAQLGLQGSLANAGGIIVSFVYRTKDAPRFHLGHRFILASLCLGFVSAGSLMLVYKWENKKRETSCIREGIDESRRAEYAHLGNKSPLFRHTL